MISVLIACLFIAHDHTAFSHRRLRGTRPVAYNLGRTAATLPPKFQRLLFELAGVLGFCSRRLPQLGLHAVLLFGPQPGVRQIRATSTCPFNPTL